MSDLFDYNGDNHGYKGGVPRRGERIALVFWFLFAVVSLSPVMLALLYGL